MAKPTDTRGDASSPQPGKTGATAARHLAFLGRAMGNADLFQDVLPVRSDESGLKAESGSGVASIPGAHTQSPQIQGQRVAAVPAATPAATLMSAMEKLRQSTRQASTASVGQIPVKQLAMRADAARSRAPSTAANALLERASGTAAPSAYKPWSGGPKTEAAKGAPSPGFAARDGGSMVNRLRATAQGLAPKQLESRDSDKWGAPLVAGGSTPPAAYPGAQDWPCNTRPPGSLQSAAAWWCARTGLSQEDHDALDEQSRVQTGSTAWVMEVMGAGGSALLCIPHKAEDRVGDKGAGAFFGQVFDGTMLVMQDGRPPMAGAVEPRRHRHGDLSFWVVRPREHYLQSNSMQSYFCSAKWSSAVKEDAVDATRHSLMQDCIDPEQEPSPAQSPS